MPPPVPASVNDGRMIAGSPTRPWAASASSSEWRDLRDFDLEPDLVHRVAEFLPVLGLVDHVGARADHLDAVLGQHAQPLQLQRDVQRGLPAHGGQQRVRPFLGDDLLDHRRGDRLNVGGVGHARIGHDGGRVRVDQDDPVALGPQRLAGLHPGIVELAGLADDDRPRADDQDGADVGAFWHARARLAGGARAARPGEASVQVKRVAYRRGQRVTTPCAGRRVARPEDLCSRGASAPPRSACPAQT